MENISVIEILKLGLPGLVFLLALLSYRLLATEQKKEIPSPRILKTIRQYMAINIFLAVLTVAGPIVQFTYFPTSQSIQVQASICGSDIEKGVVSVCHNAEYVNRYLLINDPETGKMIQAFAGQISPCSNKEYIQIHTEDAQNLGWDKTENSKKMVTVVTAQRGCKFVI